MSDSLSELSVPQDPFTQFARWFEHAQQSDVIEPTAMALATVDVGGQPSVRIVLLKGFDARGFVFHTNYASRKGRELAADPRAALLFFWIELERQVRIEGTAARVSDAESDAYFAERPRASRLSAWASPQSAPVPDRGWLEAQVTATEARFASEVPRPPHWGGLRVVPERFEFWQGRESRLHDRLVFSREGEDWAIQRLAP